MRRVALLALLCTALPASAEDRAMLGDCLDAVGAAQAATGERLYDPRSCLGAVEFLCSETGGEDCVGRERAAWEALAREALATLEASAATSETAEALVRTQADWESWLAEDCGLVVPFAEDPSMAGFARGYCERDGWADRAITLRARAANVF